MEHDQERITAIYGKFGEIGIKSPIEIKGTINEIDSITHELKSLTNGYTNLLYYWIYFVNSKLSYICADPQWENIQLNQLPDILLKSETPNRPKLKFTKQNTNNTYLFNLISYDQSLIKQTLVKNRNEEDQKQIIIEMISDDVTCNIISPFFDSQSINHIKSLTSQISSFNNTPILLPSEYLDEQIIKNKETISQINNNWTSLIANFFKLYRDKHPILNRILYYSIIQELKDDLQQANNHFTKTNYIESIRTCGTIIEQLLYIIHEMSNPNIIDKSKSYNDLFQSNQDFLIRNFDNEFTQSIDFIMKIRNKSSHGTPTFSSKYKPTYATTLFTIKITTELLTLFETKIFEQTTY